MVIGINKDQAIDILNIVLCISAKDGVLSDTEIELSRTEFSSFFNEQISIEQMDGIVDDFFNSDKQIEDYLNKIKENELKIPVLRLSIIGASSDGLDVRENMALQKAIYFWNYNLEEILNDRSWTSAQTKKWNKDTS